MLVTDNEFIILNKNIVNLTIFSLEIYFLQFVHIFLVMERKSFCSAKLSIDLPILNFRSVLIDHLQLHL